MVGHVEELDGGVPRAEGRDSREVVVDEHRRACARLPMSLRSCRTWIPSGRWALTPFTPNTVKLTPTLGALFPRGGSVPDPVLTMSLHQVLPVHRFRLSRIVSTREDRPSGADRNMAIIFRIKVRLSRIKNMAVRLLRIEICQSCVPLREGLATHRHACTSALHTGRRTPRLTAGCQRVP